MTRSWSLTLPWRRRGVIGSPQAPGHPAGPEHAKGQDQEGRAGGGTASPGRRQDPSVAPRRPRPSFKVRVEEHHELWRRDYLLRAVFKDCDLNEDGVLQVREFAAMLRDVSNRGGGACPVPKPSGREEPMRRINAQYGSASESRGGSGDRRRLLRVLLMSGLVASARDLAIARGGTYHRMLANLVVKMRKEPSVGCGGTARCVLCNL